MQSRPSPEKTPGRAGTNPRMKRIPACCYRQAGIFRRTDDTANSSPPAPARRQPPADLSRLVQTPPRQSAPPARRPGSMARARPTASTRRPPASYGTESFSSSRCRDFRNGNNEILEFQTSLTQTLLPSNLFHFTTFPQKPQLFTNRRISGILKVSILQGGLFYASLPF